MAPRSERARLIQSACLSRDLGDFVLRNEIANLAQNVKPGPCWFDSFVFHACLVAGSNRQTNTFFDFLWDGCVPLKTIAYQRPFVMLCGNFITCD
jgi:hypothetical protein